MSSSPLCRLRIRLFNETQTVKRRYKNGGYENRRIDGNRHNPPYRCGSYRVQRRHHTLFVFLHFGLHLHAVRREHQNTQGRVIFP